MLLLTVLGYVALGVVLKMNGYPNAQMVRWTPLAIHLRQNGQWLIAAPLLWAICALVSARRDRGTLMEGIVSVVGAILLCLIPMLFLYAVMNPCTRPLLISVEPTKSAQTQAKPERSTDFRASK